MRETPLFLAWDGKVREVPLFLEWGQTKGIGKVHYFGIGKLYYLRVWGSKVREAPLFVRWGQGKGRSNIYGMGKYLPK